MTKSTWGLALSGTRGRIVRDLERRVSGPGAPAELTFKREAHALREVMADAPGRVQNSVGPGRAAMEYASDPLRAEKEAFCDTILEKLEAHLRSGAYDRLVVAAGPEMLGILRERRSDALAGVTVAEDHKDLTGLDEAALRTRLADLAPSRLAG